jgi:hypothetical protein
MVAADGFDKIHFWGLQNVPVDKQQCCISREAVLLRLKVVCLTEDDLLHTMARIRAQDENFCTKLRAAIEAGQESCPIGVCTDPGTKRPLLNYQRHEFSELGND